MNFVYSTSSLYLKPTLCSIISLIDNITLDCNFVILSNDLSCEDKSKIYSMFSNSSHTISVLDIHDQLSKYAIEFNLKQSRGSYSTYARIFLSELLPDLEHVWLIDSDTLILDDLSQLRDYEDAIISACPDYVVLNKFSRHESKELSNQMYFNMGVVGLNLTKWRSNNLLAKFRFDFDGSINYKIVDQSIVNRYFNNHIKPLPLKYNYYTYFHKKFKFNFYKNQAKSDYYPDFNEFNEARLQPAIVHFIGFWFERPWYKLGSTPFKSIYYQYWSRLSDFGFTSILFDRPRVSLPRKLYSTIFSFFVRHNLNLLEYIFRYVFIQFLKFK